MNTGPEGRQFYYFNDSRTVEGPHTWEQLLELLGNGVISPATAICEGGSEEWVTFGNFIPGEEQVLADPLDVAGETPEHRRFPRLCQCPPSSESQLP